MNNDETITIKRRLENVPDFFNMRLTHDEANDIFKYAQSFGPEWVFGAMCQRKARIYCEKFLVAIENKSWNAGRCYVKGKQIWGRKDGCVLTMEDVRALEYLDDGQSNIVQGNPGDLTVVRIWECDSSD